VAQISPPWQLLRSYVISQGKLAYGSMSWFKTLNYFFLMGSEAKGIGSPLTLTHM
jgi:hypothetical protein